MSYNGPERRRFLDCPNPECRKTHDSFAEKINNAMFGPDEQSGLMKRLRHLERLVGEKVSRTAMVTTAITVVAVLVIVFVPMIAGAIRTIGVVSDRSLTTQVEYQGHKEKMETMDTSHREYVSSVESDNRMEHDAFIKRMEENNKSIRTDINSLIEASEERIKEHIDLVVKSINNNL